MRGFVSYSHEDRKVCDQLRKPLKQLTRTFKELEDFWVDTSTPTGRCFRAGYREAIDKAGIHVIMISTNSLWSDTIMDDEIPRILEKQRNHDALVLPFIVDDCLWHSVVGSLLASPRDEKLALKPFDEWRKPGQAINRAAREFEAAIKNHFGWSAQTLFDWKPK